MLFLKGPALSSLFLSIQVNEVRLCVRLGKKAMYPENN